MLQLTICQASPNNWQKRKDCNPVMEKMILHHGDAIGDFFGEL